MTQEPLLPYDFLTQPHDAQVCHCDVLLANSVKSLQRKSTSDMFMLPKPKQQLKSNLKFIPGCLARDLVFHDERRDGRWHAREHPGAGGLPSNFSAPIDWSCVHLST